MVERIKRKVLFSRTFRTVTGWAQRIVLPGFEGFSLFQILRFFMSALAADAALTITLVIVIFRHRRRRRRFCRRHCRRHCWRFAATRIFIFHGINIAWHRSFRRPWPILTLLAALLPPPSSLA